ncbi:MAG: peptidylprolyl isomerase [Endomicrobium sp.]|jgi:peptidyl-prolyl cis-trans isomerase A (cyclophilin A)|nr:peptidylprolyl isomerase [Endomicrobium sp.]
MKKISFILPLVFAVIFCGCISEPKQSFSKTEPQQAAIEQSETAITQTKETQKQTQTSLDVKSAPVQPKAAGKAAASTAVKSKEKKEMIAVIETTLGTIKIKLLPQNAPITVANFTELAQGTKEWTDPKTGKKVKKKFYDGLIFHRVIPEFMIQGGCPIGKGTGGPGYTFQDEIDPSLKFDKPGILAMANAGKNTNGSQFFITEVATPWLNGNHTIFGYVCEGMDIIKKIAHVETDFSDKPADDIVIKQIIIEGK